MFLATALALPAAGHTKADSSKVTHRIGINVRPSYILPPTNSSEAKTHLASAWTKADPHTCNIHSPFPRTAA